jgi:hypothetical protein
MGKVILREQKRSLHRSLRDARRLVARIPRSQFEQSNSNLVLLKDQSGRQIFQI